MKSTPENQLVSKATFDAFMCSELPEKLHAWAIEAQQNKEWKSELVTDFEDRINCMALLPGHGLKDRELLKGMGIVEFRQLRLRDKLGWLFLSDDSIDFDEYSSRVRITNLGLSYLEVAAT